jgi:hypothetical protein
MDLNAKKIKIKKIKLPITLLNEPQYAQWYPGSSRGTIEIEKLDRASQR